MIRFRVFAVWMAMSVAMLMNSPSGFSCSCGSRTVCELVQSPVIFIGEVVEGGITSIQRDPWNDIIRRVRLNLFVDYPRISRSWISR
jgi:hypothetical protein